MLRLTAGVGLAGAGTGVATHAAVRDEEALWVSALSGTLDLQVAAGTGSVVPTDFTDGRSVSIGFPPFPPDEPADGSATIALRSCTNPALASVFARDLRDSPLSRAIDVTLRFHPQCGTEDGGAVVYDGPLALLPDEAVDGIPLDSVPCSALGKLEYDEDAGTLTQAAAPQDTASVDDLPYTFTWDDVAVTVTAVNRVDGEVVGVDVETDDTGLCTARVKGGGKQARGQGAAEDDDSGVVTYSLGCATAATGLDAGYTPAGTRSGLSYVEFSTCTGSRTCIPCESPACVTLDWTYEPPRSRSTLDSLANQALSFDLAFSARQCRHTTTEP